MRVRWTETQGRSEGIRYQPSGVRPRARSLQLSHSCSRTSIKGSRASGVEDTVDPTLPAVLWAEVTLTLARNPTRKGRIVQINVTVTCRTGCQTATLTNEVDSVAAFQAGLQVSANIPTYFLAFVFLSIPAVAIIAFTGEFVGIHARARLLGRIRDLCARVIDTRIHTLLVIALPKVAGFAITGVIRITHRRAGSRRGILFVCAGVRITRILLLVAEETEIAAADPEAQNRQDDPQKQGYPA